VDEGFGPRGSAGAGGGSGAYGSAASRGGGGFGAAEGSAAGRGAGTGARGAGGAGGGILGPAMGAGGYQKNDGEHKRKYLLTSDEYFVDDRLVPPPVIGENPHG
jgi:hypothetical protein